MKATAFNALFYTYARGEDFTFPIGPEGTTWLLSVRACVDALVHAGTLPPGEIGGRRAFTLPAIEAGKVTARERYPVHAVAVDVSAARAETWSD